MKHRHPLSGLLSAMARKRKINRQMGYIAAWLAMLHLLAISGWSTTIIVVAFDEAVVIVADSKRVNLSTGETASVCKIHAGKQFSWVVSGLIADAMGYDVNKTIGRIAAKNDTFRSKVVTLDETMLDVIRQEATKMRRTSPKVFERYVNSSEILEFVYIGTDEGKMKVFFREYKIELVKDQVNVAWTWNRSCPGKGCRHPQMTVMGQRMDVVEPYLVTHPATLTPSSIEAAMQTGIMLVKMEAVASPDVVALPINTAIVDAQGVHWGTENEQCKDTRKAAKPAAKPQKTLKP